MTVAPSAKGTLPFGEHETWYRVTGDLRSDRPTLVVVHGGPGSTHDYLQNLSDLAVDGWSVVHYDQIGNGGSTHLPDRGTDFWTVDLFAAELDNLLTGLGIADNYVLFGQSWGGMLITHHAAARPAGLRGLVIANSCGLLSALAPGGQGPPGPAATRCQRHAAQARGCRNHRVGRIPLGHAHVLRAPRLPSQALAA